MRTSDFDFNLPPELIAQVPAAKRDQSRLLVWNRTKASLHHQNFPQLIDHLHPRDLLVLNDSRVIHARLRGSNDATGGQFELLLLEEIATNDWWAMIRPGKRARPNSRIRLKDSHQQHTPICATVLDQNEEGHRRLRFEGTDNIIRDLPTLGEIPLPPYIKRITPVADDNSRYQTVYARQEGSVAAPTAGLHFTKTLLDDIQRKEITITPVTLHVGLGTFAPVKSDDLSLHVMHRERYTITPLAARQINLAKQEGRRVIAIGTTSLRVLESAAQNGQVVPGDNSTNLFIYPPYRFQVVDALLTNFHLPRSTLLMLVSAFLSPNDSQGRDLLLKCYGEAVQHRYRFFSYGDAMLIE